MGDLSGPHAIVIAKARPHHESVLTHHPPEKSCKMKPYFQTRMPDTPEQLARKTIDELLSSAGWQVQDRKRANITVGRGVAIREFPLKPGYGFADYLLYLDGSSAGGVEAKK